MVIDPTIAIVLRILFAVLFISAAASKLDAVRFRALLEAYGLLPRFMLGFTSRLLPIVELTVGIAWAAGLFVMPAVLMTIALLGIYTAAIAIKLLRGNDSIDCGCGFGNSGQQLSWGLVLRNMVLLMLSGIALLTVTPRALVFTDFFTALTAAVVAILIYGAFNQLLLNHSAMASWRRPQGGEG